MFKVNEEILTDEEDVNKYHEFSRLNNELATAQREIIKKKVELEKLNASKDQFLGMAAHDLRTPLNGIVSLSNLLLEDTIELNEKEQLEFLQMINSSSKHMLNIINDLLDISVIETGNLQLNFEKVEIVSFMSRIINVNKIMASKKALQIVFDYDDTQEVLIDASKIEQVINNLLGNAIKFTYPNKKIFINLSILDQDLIITIEDQGKGIPEAELDKLFKPFSKISTKGTSGEQCTGLGLAIVHKIIESHKGKINVESKPGIGTKFIISLPRDAG
jgi:signal transduction histidine kinase